MVAAIGIDTGGAKHVLDPGRGRDGERGHGASHARQPDRARSRSRTASHALHRRRRQGALEGGSGGPSGGRRPSSAARCTGAQHHGPAGREPLPASGRSCGRPGSRTTRPRPRLLRNLARRLEHDAPGARARSWRAILTVIRSAYRRNFDTRWLAPTPSRTRSAPSGRSGTSSARATPRWRCVGPPPVEAQKTFRRLKAYRHRASLTPPCGRR